MLNWVKLGSFSKAISEGKRSYGRPTDGKVNMKLSKTSLLFQDRLSSEILSVACLKDELNTC
jgi:hypothetical protein